ncbi:Enamine/imine deaminase, partial [Dysosmobacter welbionis]
PLSPEYTVPGITEERIQSVIEAFGQAARRVVEAGIDVIEFHCAHNYLPHSFLSGGINRRTDGWGGSFENRKKFPLACIQAIRANMPEGMPLFMRIDCQDDMLEGGLTIEEVIDFCKCAGDVGVD